MFDVLSNGIKKAPLQPRDTNQPEKPPGTRVYHMLHICAAKADDSTSPQYNSDPDLDSTNWETLPAELKKVYSDLQLLVNCVH